MVESSNVKVSKKMNTKAIVGILIFSAFMASFTETILNVALNTLMVEMDVTAGTIQWLLTGYMIVVAVMVPVTAFLIQTFETKKLFLTAMGLLLLGSIFAIFSGSFGTLLASRMIQALGTGMMIPIMMNTVLVVTPAEKHGSALGLCGSAIMVGPALGPTVAGIILEYFSWQALFVLLLPLIIIAMVFGAIYLVNTATLTKPKLDIPSVILSTVGVGGIIYGLSSFSGSGNMMLTTIVVIVGLLALLIFGKRQLSIKEPLLEIRTFKHPMFSVGAALVMITMMVMFTMSVLLPMFFQGSLGTTTSVAALAILPGTIVSLIMTPVGGKIYDKFGPKVIIPLGFLIMLLGMLVISRSTSSTAIMQIAVAYMVVSIGGAFTMSNSQTNALNQLSREAYPHGVAIVNTLQQIAAAIGSALFIGIMSASQLKELNNSASAELATATGFRSAIFAVLIFIVVGIVLAFILSAGNKKQSMAQNLQVENQEA